MSKNINTEKNFLDEMIDFCQRLVQTKSIHQNEKEIADLLRQEMKNLNFKEVKIDAAGNVTGKLPGKKEKPSKKSILFDFHLDTVRAQEENWEYPPFAGRKEQGKIYGRGTADMKGALAAAVYSLNYLSMNEEITHDIYLSGTTCEELHEGATFTEVLDMIEPDLVIIGEASDCQLMNGQRGRAEIGVKTFGQSAHTSNPDEGINAVKNMRLFLDRIEEIELPIDENLGRAILELSDIRSQPYPGRSVIPHLCEATFDRRLLLSETKQSVLEPLKLIIDNLSQNNSEFKAEVGINQAEFSTYTSKEYFMPKFAPAWYYSQDNKFVNKAIYALEKCGLSGQLGTYEFCTNGSMSAGNYDIKTLGFGPATEERAHTVDEYIRISELKQAARGYYSLGEVFAV